MFVIVKASLHVSTEKLHEGCVKRLIHHEANLPLDTPECCIFVHTSIGCALSVVLYFHIAIMLKIMLSNSKLCSQTQDYSRELTILLEYICIS